jgi:multidrug resistance protein, MATE family
MRLAELAVILPGALPADVSHSRLQIFMTSSPGPVVLAKPPGLKSLLGLAWPVIISRASQVVVGLSDAVMVAHLGETPLAATTTGAMNAFTLFIFPMGVVFIVSSYSAQLFGKGDKGGAFRYGLYGLFVALLTQLVAFVSLPFVAPAMGLFSYTPEVRESIAQYLRIRLLSGGAAVGIEALGNYYGGLGNTRLPMVISLLAMALNVLGNWLLIDGHLGLPAMGVRGAALASTLSTLAAFLVMAALFGRDARANKVSLAQLHWRELLRMMRFGVPSGLNWLLEFLAFSFFVNVIVAGLGTTALAALMSVMQINAFSFMPAFAVSSAGAFLAGQAIGAGCKDHVPLIARLTVKVTASWQGLVGLSYFLLPGLLFAPFARGGPESHALLLLGTRLLMLSATWQLFDAVATTMAEILRAAGDTAFTLWARVLLAWAVFVPGAYLSTRYLGWRETGAVVWLVTYLALLAAVLVLRFARAAWRRIDITASVHPGT